MENIGLSANTIKQLEERREKAVNGDVNCILSPFKRFRNDFFGIEQDTYYCITSFTKGGKCFAKGTQVRMADNSIKNIEDIKPHDLVMSPNLEAAKEVICINKGKEPLYQITSELYNPITVNASHIMYLYDCYSKKYITMTMEKLFQIYNTMDWNYFCRKYKMVASDAVSIDGSTENLPIEPYFYGLWLGDGDTKDTYITTPNKEIVTYLQEYANKLGLYLTSYKGNRSCSRYRISQKHRNEYNFKESFAKVCLWNKKHINKEYLNSTIHNRYELLAGIIDTDGYLNPNKTGYRICLQYESLIDDIIDLARSLGLTCSKTVKYNKKYNKNYYQISISGINCCKIPTKVKKITHISKVNRLHYTFKINEVGEGEYYGIKVGGNHLFLLKDYTVVHNSQFTSYTFIFMTIINAYYSKKKLDFKIIYFPLEETKERILQRFMSWLLYKFSKGKIRVSPSELRSTISPVSKDVLDKLKTKEIQSLLKFFEEHIIFPEEGSNPTGIYKYCKQYAEEHGTVKTKTIKKKDEFGVEQEYEKFYSYTQDNPNEYRMIIIDTINLIDCERGMTLKQSIDKLSEYCAKYLRNRYHYSPIIIQQQAFDSESNDAFKIGKVRPSVAGLGDSKYTSRDKQFIYTKLR